MGQAVAVVAGVGPGLGASLCRRLAREGYAVAGLARGATTGEALAAEIGEEGGGFEFFPCDLTDAAAVTAALDAVEQRLGPPAVYVHNAAELHIAPFAETPPERFEALWRVICLAAVLGAQRVVPGMAARGSGTILFTGATAGIKAGAHFAAFASAKFALRGLAQALAREYGPQGVHVAHVVIDGLIDGGPAARRFAVPPERCLSPDAVAGVYLDLIRQGRSAWTHELDLRPDVEPF